MGIVNNGGDGEPQGKRSTARGQRCLHPGNAENKAYRRHVTGAWVRSGASLFLWLIASGAYLTNFIDVNAYKGISYSVLYLILINPPTLWVMSRLNKKTQLGLVSLTINALEALGYTAIIYFNGGLNRSYLTLIYPVLITYVGMTAPRFWPFMVTVFCSLAFTGMVVLEYFKVIPQTQIYLAAPLPLGRQLFEVGIITGFLFFTAFFSSYTSQLIKRSRAQLKEQNVSLKESHTELEQAARDLRRKNLELRAATEKAQASDRMKSEFLTNMSHELRTPLNHIMGFSELLYNKYFGELNPTQEEHLGNILTSSNHLLSLINDILDLSKIEAGKMELECSEVPLQGILENSLTMVEEGALKHKIRLTSNFVDIPPTLYADERKVKQILYNLLSNAVKFTPDGGAVHLEVRGLEGKGIEIRVSDNGIGMPNTDLERIFQPFEQADNSSSRKYQGTGLGLSLAKRMVEMHGGRIWAESPGTGLGSSFYVTIPL
jgi:signal transduction histidine kinase